LRAAGVAAFTIAGMPRGFKDAQNHLNDLRDRRGWKPRWATASDMILTPCVRRGCPAGKDHAQIPLSRIPDASWHLANLFRRYRTYDRTDLALMGIW